MATPWRSEEEREEYLGKHEDAPTADAEEVKHGEWVMDEIAGMEVCSECKGVILGTVFGQWLFVNMETMWCPHCGAKMDRERKRHK